MKWKPHEMQKKKKSQKEKEEPSPNCGEVGVIVPLLLTCFRCAGIYIYSFIIFFFNYFKYKTPSNYT